MSTISLNNVSFRYDLADRYALTDFSYEFKQGTFYAIIGENGGGKTTLLNIIRGFTPQFFSGELKGTVALDNVPINEYDDASLSIKMGYVFQNPFTQISGIKETVLEEVAIGLENLGVCRNIIIEKVLSIAQLLGIEELLDKNPNELSGGQRQRVAFASIIVMDAEILIIDEPTSQLDPQGSEIVFDIISKMKELGKTIILAEHKVNSIADYADEVIVLKAGRIVSSGDTNSVLSNLELLHEGANIPQITKLFSAIELECNILKGENLPVTLCEAIYKNMNLRKSR